MPPLEAPDREILAEGIILMRGWDTAAALDAALLLLQVAPPRVMVTPSGKKMSVAMTNCGALGWISDLHGYRYSPVDPLTGQSWPAMPASLVSLAGAAAAAAGFHGFAPEACLINLYAAESRMGLHQDRDEAALDQPIVSVSLGRGALFRFGGPTRRDPTRSVRLRHGDVVVFGGPARLVHHGIDRLVGPAHAITGDRRINLTFRRVTPASRNYA